MIWFVDSHVHYHPVFGWRRFLSGALIHLDRLARAEPEGTAVAGCLCFVDPPQICSPAALESAVASGVDRILPADCSLERVGESGALRLERRDAPPLLLIPGRQIATREGLEVLALANRAPVPDGLPLARSVEASLASAELTVLPWGFGKWWGRRGRILERVFLEAHAAPVYLGDNGNRAALASEPPLFAESLRRGRPILTGSDPLPFAHHADRALGYAFRLEGDLDVDAPGASLRRALAGMRTSPTVVGKRSTVPQFLNDQIRMQWKVRGRRTRPSTAAGGTPR